VYHTTDQEVYKPANKNYREDKQPLAMGRNIQMLQFTPIHLEKRDYRQYQQQQKQTTYSFGNNSTGFHEGQN
jgi:hypothetical protein